MTTLSLLQLMPQNTLQPSVPFNRDMQVIAALLVLVVEDMSLTAPPSTLEGDVGRVWIVGTSATGAWAGEDNNLALCTAPGLWLFLEPPVQTRGRILNDGGTPLNVYYRWSGSAWVDDTAAGAVSEAPNDGTRYLRRNEAWEPLVIPVQFATVVNTSDENTDADETNSNNYTRFSHASATYTFNDAEPFVVNAEYHGRYVGSGTLTIVEAGGMTINPPAEGSLIIPSGGTFTIKIVAEDEADLMGVTEPEL